METQPPSNAQGTALSVSSAKYTPIAELGRGGMATAYLAAVQGLGGFNKLVVIKRLRPSLAAEPDFLKMFLDEARLSARIDHPNVVHTTEVGFDGEHHFIAMEFLDGQSLEGVIRRLAKRRVQAGGSLNEVGGEADMPLKFHLYILSQMLQGLDFAHELKDFDGIPLNVVHRDVSPHNVMVTFEGHVKVLDFGIAKAADSSGDTRTGVMKGKCAYMPAEQFGGKGIDRRADVFAVGIIFWQALAGRKLWKGLSDAEIFQRVASGDIPKPSSVHSGVPAELEEICMKALSRRPSDRYATAADFQASLDDYVARHPELRATPKELGKFVADLFVEERRKLKEIIESQLGRAVQRSAPVPVFTTGTSGSGSSLGSAAASVSTSFGAPATGSRRVLIGVLVILAVTAGATLFIRSKLGVAPPAASTDSPANTTCTVTIRVAPVEAKIFIDDAPVEGNPATTMFRRDTVKHRVRAEAPGYVAKAEWIALEGSHLTIDLALDPVPSSEPKVVKPDPKDSKEPRRPPIQWPYKPPTSQPVGSVTPPPPVVTTATPVSPPTVTQPPPTTSKSSGPHLDTDDPWSPNPKK
jgi:serine/threonine-protein kinase